MADSVKKQQGRTGKPGRPKGSTTKKETTAGNSRKRSTASGTKRSSSRQAPEAVYEEDDLGFMRAEVIIICSFAVAILLFLSNFGLCGIVGQILKGIQLGLFGILGYLLPILIFVGTCFHLSNQGNIHAAIKLGAVIGALITLCGNADLCRCFKWRRRRRSGRRSAGYGSYVLCWKSRRLSGIFGNPDPVHGMYNR